MVGCSPMVTVHIFQNLENHQHEQGNLSGCFSRLRLIKESTAMTMMTSPRVEA